MGALPLDHRVISSIHTGDVGCGSDVDSWDIKTAHLLGCGSDVDSWDIKTAHRPEKSVIGRTCAYDAACDSMKVTNPLEGNRMRFDSMDVDKEEEVSKPHEVVQEESSDSDCTEDEYCKLKLFVGNIGYKQNWKHLKDLFSQFGEVVYAKVVYNHFTHRSRGIGFVEFASLQAFDDCWSAAHSPEGLVLDGRRLRIQQLDEYRKSSWNGRHAREVALSPSHLPVVNDEGERSLITRLNVHVWCHIMKYLSITDQIRLESVCRQLRCMILEAWKHRTVLELRDHCMQLLTLPALTSLFNRCGTLTGFDTCYARGMPPEITTLITARCPRLRELTLTGVSIPTQNMRKMTKVLRHLKRVSLDSCWDVGDKGLWWLFKNCRNLEYLSIGDNYMVIGKCFYMASPNLKYLHARSCSWMGDCAIELLAEKCPNLRELHLQQCVRLTENCLHSLARITSLEVLDIRKDFNRPECRLKNEELWTVLGQLRNLRVLKMDEIDQVTDNVLRAITRGCTNLRELSLQRCRPNVSKAGLLCLLDLKELAVVDTSYIWEVDDDFVIQLASRGNLQSLTLRCCRKVSDEGIQTVLNMSPYLLRLDLSGCWSLTKNALTPLTTTAAATTAAWENLTSHPVLTVWLGGTMMACSDAAAYLVELRAQLLPHVELLETDLSDDLESIFNHDGVILLPDPWEEEEEVEEVPKVVPVPVKRVEKEDSDMPGCVLLPEYIPDCGDDEEEWGASEQPAESAASAPVEEERVEKEDSDRPSCALLPECIFDCGDDEEEWGASAASLLIKEDTADRGAVGGILPEELPPFFYDDCICSDYYSDEDYDFLENDDPLQRDRWDLM